MNLKKLSEMAKKQNDIISDEMAKEMGFAQEVLETIKQVANNKALFGETKAAKKLILWRD
ncbi:hypothetical protein [Ureibacillus terrenus]|uniref:Uncharacterized protein n=1 Tax=Ureibacillus terrenus TaxID=118246 RepID=A0A540V5E1_9BACL|nr:hypothetical protein [Ureibacillus terrenus]TQE91977.1 hypothetical protein FKZ59_02485 [Ureibacillus terrenus]